MFWLRQNSIFLISYFFFILYYLNKLLPAKLQFTTIYILGVKGCDSEKGIGGLTGAARVKP
jgi:hypothetical protein